MVVLGEGTPPAGPFWNGGVFLGQPHDAGASPAPVGGGEAGGPTEEPTSQRSRG